MDQELIEYLQRRFDQADQRFDQLIEGMRTENRQTRVLIEDLRGQIQLVAEGVTGQQQQLDRFREEVAEEFRETKALIRLSYAELDQRVKGLEIQVAKLDERLTSLETAA